jgi:peptide/nickel transport system ATP-binding protein
LLSAIPKLTDRSHTRLNAIGGRPPDLVSPPKGCPFSPRCPYARERCHEERPVLTESPTTPGHFYACFYPVGSPETAEIKERLAAQRGAVPGGEPPLPQPPVAPPPEPARRPPAPPTNLPPTNLPPTNLPPAPGGPTTGGPR